MFFETTNSPSVDRQKDFLSHRKKMEAGSSSNSRACPNSVMGLGEGNQNNNVNNGLSSIVMMNSSAGTSSGKAFLPPLGAAANSSYDGSSRNAGCFIHSGDICNAMKAKIMAHPHFPRLLAAYVNCQKVKNCNY